MSSPEGWKTIGESDLHPHIRRRMDQRGVSLREIERTLNEGWKAEDAVQGTEGRVYVFEYNDVWEGKGYKEKEVTVYFKWVRGQLVLLTTKARYGSSFKRRFEK
jgi:hypothetical protein